MFVTPAVVILLAVAIHVQPTSAQTTTTTTTTRVPNATTTTTTPPPPATPAPAPAITCTSNATDSSLTPLLWRQSVASATKINITRVRITAFNAAQQGDGRVVTTLTFSFNQRTDDERLRNESNSVALTILFQTLYLDQTLPASKAYLATLNIAYCSFGELFSEAPVPSTTIRKTTPVPTINVSDVGTAPPEPDNSGMIYAIVFGTLGGIALIGGGVFVVKKFVMRDDGKHKKTVAGYRYAR